jgi:hypothetical protein
MQRRETVLKTKLAQAQHAMNAAIAARSRAVMDYGRGAVDEAKLDAAIQAVKTQQGIVETIESALETARREDCEEDFSAKRAGWIAAREKAIEISASREKAAKAAETAVKALAVALRDLDAQNDATLQAIYLATAGAEPKDERERNAFGLRLGLAPNAVHMNLRQAFVIALKDAGVGEIGVDLTGMLEFHNPSFLAHGKRDGMVAAVRASTQMIDTALIELHTQLRIIPPAVAEPDPNAVQAHDPYGQPIFDADGNPVLYVPAYAPPVQTLIRVKDRLTGEMVDELYTCDATTVEWGLPPGSVPVSWGAQ